MRMQMAERLSPTVYAPFTCLEKMTLYDFPNRRRFFRQLDEQKPTLERSLENTRFARAVPKLSDSSVLELISRSVQFLASEKLSR